MKKKRYSGTARVKDRSGYMEEALRLAARAGERTYPNPMVGAVVVSKGKVVGRGYHKRPGGPHAEVYAIRNSSSGLKGAEMYVTLEPCATYGRTPPCSDLIIASGIRAVHIAMKDPNPVNGGKGIAKLRRAGIQVTVGICRDRAAHLNRKYVKYIKEGLPYVTLKAAQSLDGKIAARDGSSEWISCEASRRFARRERRRFNAIMVGVNTVLRDDPTLSDERRHKPPLTRIVVDSRLRMSLSSKLVRTADTAPLLIAVTEKAPARKVSAFRKAPGVRVEIFRGIAGKVPLRPFLKKVARGGMVNVLVEGGGEIAGSLRDEGLIDEVMFFLSPCLIGGAFSSVKGRGAKNIASADGFANVSIRRVGDDLLFRGEICSRG